MEYSNEWYLSKYAYSTCVCITQTFLISFVRITWRVYLSIKTNKKAMELFNSYISQID